MLQCLAPNVSNVHSSWEQKCQQHIQTIRKRRFLRARKLLQMKAFKGVSSAVPMAHGSSLTDIFNVVNKFFIPRHRKESYVDKKFEETAL